MLALLRRLRSGLSQWLERRELSGSALTFAASIVVGVGAGLGASVFR